MSPGQRLLDQPEQQAHFVQLYGADESSLAKNVGHYLREGTKRGDGLLVIATKAHTEAFKREINGLTAVFLDAHETLARLLVRGQPDWSLFESAVGAAMRQVQTPPGHVGFRAYGEMVGILWKAGLYAAAIQLEKFWNRQLKSNHFNLFCGYAIDVFSNEFQIAALDALLCAHTHVVPAGQNGDLESAIDRSMDDILGRRAAGLRLLMEANFRPSWARLPRAEASILWLRNSLPDEADKILARARQYYQVSQLRSKGEFHGFFSPGRMKIV